MDSTFRGSFHLWNLWELKPLMHRRRWWLLHHVLFAFAGQRSTRAEMSSLPLPGSGCIHVSAQKVDDTHTCICFISFQAKTIDSTMIDAMDRESSVSLIDPPLAYKFNSTVSPAKTKQAYLPTNEGERFSFLQAYVRTAEGKCGWHLEIIQVSSVVVSTQYFWRTAMCTTECFRSLFFKTCWDVCLGKQFSNAAIVLTWRHSH